MPEARSPIFGAWRADRFSGQMSRLNDDIFQRSVMIFNKCIYYIFTCTYDVLTLNLGRINKINPPGNDKGFFSSGAKIRRRSTTITNRAQCKYYKTILNMHI